MKDSVHYYVYSQRVENRGYPYYKLAATKSKPKGRGQHSATKFAITKDALAVAIADSTWNGRVDNESLAQKIAKIGEIVQGHEIVDLNAPKPWE